MKQINGLMVALVIAVAAVMICSHPAKAQTQPPSKVHSHNIIAVTEGQEAFSAGQTVPGVVALCEKLNEDGTGCDTTVTQSVFIVPGPEGKGESTGVSDFVIFVNDPAGGTVIIMCSDPTDDGASDTGDQACPNTVDELNKTATVHLKEADCIDGQELTNYAPEAGQPGDLPGFFQTYNIISDSGGCDTGSGAQLLKKPGTQPVIQAGKANGPGGPGASGSSASKK